MSSQMSEKRVLFLIFLTILLDLIAFGLLIPVIVPISLELGWSVSMGSVLQTSVGLGSLLSSYSLGRWSDRRGRKFVLRLSLMISLVGQVLTLIGGGVYPFYLILVLGRFLTGVGLGNISVAQAVLADLSPPELRRKRFALIGIAFGIGFTIGPGIGALIAQIIRSDLLVWLSSVGILISIVNVLLIHFLFPDQINSFRHVSFESFNLNPLYIGKVFRQQPPVLKTLYKALLLNVLAFVGIESLLSVILTQVYEIPLQKTFMYYLWLGIISVVSNGLLSRRAFSWSDFTQAIFGQLTLGLSLLLIIFTAPHIAVLYVILIMLSASGAFFNPAVNALLSLYGDSRQHGLVFGLSQTVGTLGRILGPIIFGGLYELYGLPSLWFSIVSLVISGSLIAWQKSQSEKTPIRPSHTPH